MSCKDVERCYIVLMYEIDFVGVLVCFVCFYEVKERVFGGLRYSFGGKVCY